MLHITENLQVKMKNVLLIALQRCILKQKKGGVQYGNENI